MRNPPFKLISQPQFSRVFQVRRLVGKIGIEFETERIGVVRLVYMIVYGKILHPLVDRFLKYGTSVFHRRDSKRRRQGGQGVLLRFRRIIPLLTMGPKSAKSMNETFSTSHRTQTMSGCATISLTPVRRFWISSIVFNAVKGLRKLRSSSVLNVVETITSSEYWYARLIGARLLMPPSINRWPLYSTDGK